MRVCGVELKGSDAIVVVIDMSSDQLNIVDTGVNKITLGNSEKASDVQALYNTFHSFIRNYNIERVVIKKRSIKGQFAGGAVSFKIEGLIQLSNDADVILIPAPTIAAQKKRVKFPPCPDTLYNYQTVAFETACSYYFSLKNA